MKHIINLTIIIIQKNNQIQQQINIKTQEKPIKQCNTVKFQEEIKSTEKQGFTQKNKISSKITPIINIDNQEGKKQQIIQNQQKNNNIKIKSIQHQQKIYNINQNSIIQSQKNNNIQPNHQKHTKHLPQQQRTQHRQRAIKNRLNLLNYIKKRFSTPNDNITLLQLVNQLQYSQHIFIKTILVSIIHLSKINNPRLNSNTLGDQFKYYRPENKISHRLFRKNTNLNNPIPPFNANQDIIKQQHNHNYYKLTYPSKLLSHFKLKHNQHRQQYELFQTLTQTQSSQLQSNNSSQSIKRYPQPIIKYFCEQWTKQPVSLLQNPIDSIITKRLKITTHLIQYVTFDKFPWIFAAEKGYYKF